MCRFTFSNVFFSYNYQEQRDENDRARDDMLNKFSTLEIENSTVTGYTSDACKQTMTKTVSGTC